MRHIDDDDTVMVPRIDVTDSCTDNDDTVIVPRIVDDDTVIVPRIDVTASHISDDDTVFLPPADRAARTRSSHLVVSLLSTYSFLLLFIPATLIFGPLGGAGTPATVAALMLTLWCIASWMGGRIVPSGGSRGIRTATLIFSLAILASFIAGMTRDITQLEVLAADRGLILLASWIGLVVSSQFITDYQQLNRLLRRLVVGGSIIAAVGILQFRSIDLTRYIQIPGLQVNSAAGLVQLTRNGFNRPWGTATQPIEYGVVLAMLLPFAIQQAFDPANGGKLARWLPVILLAFTVPLTVSRSGIVGLGVTLIVLLPTWSSRQRWLSIPIVGFGFAAMHLFVRGLIGTFIGLFKGIFTGQDSSVTARTADYSGVTHYLQERPFFGRGFGTFLPQLYRFTDNTYLLGLVETGIVGVAALLLLFITGMRYSAAGRRLTQDQRRRETGQALTASVAVAMVTSVTFDSMSFPMFTGLFFLILGCAGAYRQIMAQDTLDPESSHRADAEPARQIDDDTIQFSSQVF
jgi:O-antigen ligase